MQDSARPLTTSFCPFPQNKQKQLAINTLMIIERNNNALYELLVTDFSYNYSWSVGIQVTNVIESKKSGESKQLAGYVFACCIVLEPS